MKVAPKLIFLVRLSPSLSNFGAALAIPAVLVPPPLLLNRDIFFCPPLSHLSVWHS